MKGLCVCFFGNHYCKGFHDSFAPWVFAGVFPSLLFLKPSENRLFNLPRFQGFSSC